MERKARAYPVVSGAAIKVAPSLARSFVRFQTGFGAGIRIARDAVALKAMWRAAHPRATANRCLEIQIYRPRCSRAASTAGEIRSLSL